MTGIVTERENKLSKAMTGMGRLAKCSLAVLGHGGQQPYHLATSPYPRALPFKLLAETVLETLSSLAPSFDAVGRTRVSFAFPAQESPSSWLYRFPVGQDRAGLAGRPCLRTGCTLIRGNR
jgi:hypothetical protein